MKTVTYSIILVTLFLFGCDDSQKIQTCGDGVVDTDEECDQSSFISGTDCRDYGYNDGEVYCTADCKLDLHECIDSGICGDDEITGNEDCEEGDLNGKDCVALGYTGGGTLSCGSNCMYDRTQCAGYGICGNGIIEGTETCDGTNFGGDTCESLGYNGGELFCDPNNCTIILDECTATGRCGDGILTTPWEDCEGQNLNDATCSSIGFYEGGQLVCDSSCKFDTTLCEGGRCGDSEINTGEQCDGDNLNGESCTHMGYYNGTLICDENCRFDISSCEAAGICGDEIIQDTEGEECDGDNLGTAVTCQDVNPQYYDSQNIVCSSNCAYDVSVCEYCGDGIIQATEGEECDGTNLNALICEDIGFNLGGEITCTSTTCGYDSSRCNWGITGGTTESDYNNAMALNASGYIYLAGTTSGVLPGQTDLSGSDAYVIKLDPQGNWLWNIQFGTYNVDEGAVIATDSSGNIFVGGRTTGAFPGYTNTGSYDLFIRKLDPDGATYWTRQFGTSSLEYIKSMRVDPSGNVIAIGITEGGLHGYINAGEWDAFVTKYDTNGNLLWTRQFGTPSTESLESLEIDSAGNIYITGSSMESINGQQAHGLNDAFLIKYDPDGNVVFTKQFGTADSDYGNGLALDSTGNIYVSGNTNGTLSGELNAGSYDYFLYKFDATGNELWHRQFGTSLFESANGVVTYNNSVYVFGTDNRLTMTEFDQGGNQISQKIWAYTISGMTDSSLAVSSNGTLYISGSTTDTFPGYNNLGNYDYFVMTWVP